MYREMIEHPWSIPDDIKAHLDLTSGRDRGRIYRLAPPGYQRPAHAATGRATTAELVATLEHPNAWYRETAQRLLYERQDRAAVAAAAEAGRREPVAARPGCTPSGALDGLGRPRRPRTSSRP